MKEKANDKSLGKLCGGCFVHADSPELEQAPYNKYQTVMTSCVPQLNHDLNHDAVNNSGYPRVQVVPGVTQRGGTMSNLNDMINRPPERVGSGGEMDHILDLVYITERIISMSFASEEHETTYKGNLKEVTRMLKTKHGENYLVINISDKRADLAKHCPQVLDYGWPEHLAPPLERLCSVCKAIDSWLGSDINHVVVVHCKGGRGRIAVVIAAYMRYSNICASADQALDRFAMKRFYDDKLGGLPQPSQRRYVHYFAGLLSGAIQINSSALYLHHILIHGVPNFDMKGGCRPFIKVYQGMHPIFTSGVYNVTDNMQKVCISISPGIPLRGDILIKCYHKKNKAGQREIMWGCQFHTCAISHNSLVFSKNELDEAINDPRFPDTGKVEFVFGNNSEGLVQVSDFKSDVTVPVDDVTDALTRWDSYENFSKHVDGKETDVNANGLPESKSSGVGSFRVNPLDHSQGPVDGGLYAQVQKQSGLESQIIHNGPAKLHNGGSFTSSLDSGISAFSSVPIGNLTQKSNVSSESWSTTREVKEQPSFSSYTQKSYSSTSSAPRSTTSAPRSTSSAPRSKATKEEQSQLDQILSDLLNDQAFVSQKSPSGRSYSSETRSFKTVEDHMSPEGNIVVQRSDVTYKVPEAKKEEQHYTMKTQTKTMTEDSKSSYRPVNAFTYTPQSPEQSRSFEPIRSPRSPVSPRGYSNKYNKSESYSYNTGGSGSLSDGEHSLSWLQQQQQKLRDKSEERDPQREYQEKMIINELKSAQASSKFKQRSMSEDESTSESFKKSSPLMNGPTSPYSYTVSRTHTYSNDKEKDSPFRATETIPISQSHTTYTTQYQTDTHGSKISNKPPPSPIQRTVTPTMNIAPIPPPQRTSSKDYMQYQHNRYRSNSTSGTGSNSQATSSSWQSQAQAEPRVMQRHYSETASSADKYEKELLPRSYSQTPPAVSPRAASPQTYQTYRTVYKTVHNDKVDQPDFARPQASPPPVEVKIERQMESKRQMESMPQQAPTNKPHYITEVFVNRSAGADLKSGTLDRADSDKRLEALEKSLQAAQASIIAQTPWQPQQPQQVQQQQQEVRRYETRSYETKSEQMHQNQNQQQQQQLEKQIVSRGANSGYPRSMSPVWDNLPSHVQQHQDAPPKKLEVTEEDRITLKPIGPGVHQLEPEGVHTGTLGRESTGTSTLGRESTGTSTLGRTTPSFPISPVVSAEMFIQSVHDKARRMSLGSRDDLHGRSFHVTPPFPTTPKTPYQNISVTSSPYRLLSDTSSSNWYSTLDNPSSTPDTLRAATPDSVFERDLAYNTIVSRQLMKTSDPLYASIPENVGGNRPAVGGGQVTSPPGTLNESQRMQYQTYSQQQNYQTQTLPQQSAPPSQAPPGFQTLPQQTSPPPAYGQMQPAFQTLPSQAQQLQQQQQQQTQQNQQQQYHYQTEQKQQYQTQQHSQQQFTSGSSGSQFAGSGAQQNGSLHIDTNPRMLQSYPSKSPSSPGSPSNLDTLRQQLHIAHNMSGSTVSPGPQSATGQSSPSVYFGLSRRGSLTSLADSEAVHTTPKFVKDTSKFWYKPNITREEAIIILKDKAPGTFVVRDSNSFPGAFGLALKVAQIPANVQAKSTGDPMADLVRHFLIEPTPKGVRLRGCSNEPVFGSLAALVYQHSMTPLALPCKLVLPEQDPAHIVGDITPSDASMTSEVPNSASALLAQGAACNVLFLNTVDTESLTGPQAVARACKLTFDYPPPKITQVHFKVSNQGITLTDNQRKLFFRRHYPVAAVTYCGMDPDDRKWKRETDVPGVQADAKVFGFVARKQGGVSDNACHLFAELDPDQPASAIVNFVTRIMIGQSKIKS